MPWPMAYLLTDHRYKPTSWPVTYLSICPRYTQRHGHWPSDLLTYMPQIEPTPLASALHIRQYWLTLEVRSRCMKPFEWRYLRPLAMSQASLILIGQGRGRDLSASSSSRLPPLMYWTTNKRKQFVIIPIATNF